MTTRLLSPILFAIIGMTIGYYLAQNKGENNSLAQESIVSEFRDCPKPAAQTRTLNHSPFSSSNEACSCDDTPICEPSDLSAENRSPIDEIFTKLLEDYEYSEAINLYAAISHSSENEASKLKVIFMSHLEDLLTQSYEPNIRFEDLTNTYLADFHSDIEVLLKVAAYQSVIGRYYEGVGTLQLAHSYIISDADQGKFNRQYREYMDLAIESLFDQSGGSEVIGYYDFVNTAGLLQNEDRFNLVSLYLNQGSRFLAEQEAVILFQDDQWRAKTEQLFKQSTPQSKPDFVAKRDFESKVTMRRRGSHFLVPVTLTDDNAQLLLDTGASITTLTRSYYDDVKHRLNLKYQRSAMFNTANGAVKADVYRVDQFTIGQYKIPDLEVTVLDYPSPGDTHGLLGMNVLRYFRFQINQQSAELELTPQK